MLLPMDSRSPPGACVAACVEHTHLEALVSPCVAGPEGGVIGAPPQLAVLAILLVRLLPPCRRRRRIAYVCREGQGEGKAEG